MTSSAPSSASSQVEFWFEFGSNCSYLSVMRIEDEARRLGVHISWKPFLLGPIFRELGMENSPFVLQKEKGAYVQHDMTRLCRKYGLSPWVKPSVFPRLCVLPLRIVLLAAGQPWIGAFCRKVMELNFALDQDINHPEQMASVLTELGLPSSDVLQQAQSEPIKARLREQTDDRCPRTFRSRRKKSEHRICLARALRLGVEASIRPGSTLNAVRLSSEGFVN
jgi:2-hydroxychromene-2-carboxylate isomerase